MDEFIKAIRKHEGERLVAIVCTDYPSRFNLVYYFDKNRVLLTEEFNVPREDPVIPSIIESSPVAMFYEQEIRETFGVNFIGLEPKHLFLSDELEKKHPMRRYK